MKKMLSNVLVDDTQIPLPPTGAPLYNVTTTNQTPFPITRCV
jgi:hypothetical protein